MNFWLQYIRQELFLNKAFPEYKNTYKWGILTPAHYILISLMNKGKTNKSIFLQLILNFWNNTEWQHENLIILKLNRWPNLMDNIYNIHSSLFFSQYLLCWALKIN